MFFSNLFEKKKSILGVDIGTANIKVVQISHGQTPVLDTYGIVNTPYQLGGKNDDLALPDMAKLLKTLVGKAGVTAKRCVISFPNIAVFSSVIELPAMKEADLDSAVEHEAKKHVPLALSDIDLSWTQISDGSTKGMKILLTAVPKQITKNYLRLFDLAGLEPEVGEIEALALIRSLIGNAPSNCVIIDIGAKITGLNIIENGFLRLSRNLNVGGETITLKIAQTLNISEARAEQFKKDFGVSGNTFIPDAIKPVLNVIKTETKQLLTLYQSQNNKKLDKIILVGGGSNLPALSSFFSDLQVAIELGDPLKTISYSQSLSPVLKRYASSLPIAIGLALRHE
jgi:type IV pilus assembly protein PilM